MRSAPLSTGALTERTMYRKFAILAGILTLLMLTLITQRCEEAPSPPKIDAKANRLINVTVSGFEPTSTPEECVKEAIEVARARGRHVGLMWRRENGKS